MFSLPNFVVACRIYNVETNTHKIRLMFFVKKMSSNFHLWQYRNMMKYYLTILRKCLWKFLMLIAIIMIVMRYKQFRKSTKWNLHFGYPPMGILSQNFKDKLWMFAKLDPRWNLEIVKYLTRWTSKLAALNVDKDFA